MFPLSRVDDLNLKKLDAPIFAWLTTISNPHPTYETDGKVIFPGHVMT